jgi:hypothetical protein
VYTSHISGIIKRELQTLKDELSGYENESDMWVLRDGISNSAGTLALHICGNLSHFVGAILGDNGYVRTRDAEFADRNVPREEVLRRIDETIDAVTKALENQTDDNLEEFPKFDFGKFAPEAPDFLIHLVSHLAFHLGQVNYHRRLITGIRGDVKVLEIPKLRTAGRVN